MYKYHYIANQIEDQIHNNTYTSGMRLPAIRQLAMDYQSSHSTIIKSLDVLKSKGLIYSLPQSGYYIATGTSSNSTVHGSPINLFSSTPNPLLFPYQDFQSCVNQAINQYKTKLFQYGTYRGDESLHNSIAKSLREDQIFCKKENLVVTNGTQQALSILMNMNLPNGKEKILIEQPTYHVVAEMMDDLNYDRTYIERIEGEGYDFDLLESIFKNDPIKCFYLMARVHNPLGIDLREDQKKRLIHLAYKYDVYLIEDDYMADYVIASKSLPLYSYDYRFSHVIYLKSFSKIIFPGLRVGIALLPETVVDAFSKRKIYASLDTAMLSQASLDIYIRNGMYKRHCAKMKKLYQQRAQQMHETIDRWSINKQLISPTAHHPFYSDQIHTCIDINRAISNKYLEEHSFLIRDIEHNYCHDYTNKRSLLPINVSNLEVAVIENVLNQLLNLLK